MSSSANQPVCVGTSCVRTDLAEPHERKAGRAEQVLDRPTRDDVGAERAHVDLDRADRLIAVGQHQRAVFVAELGDRRDVVAVPRAERERSAAHERRALVDRVGEAIQGDAPVCVRQDVHDLRAAQLLRMCDLTDGRELVLADDDAVPLAGEVERRDERTDAL